MIKAEIIRDENGFPSIVTLVDGTNRATVNFDRDTGFTIMPSRRGGFTEDMWQALQLIYPQQKNVEFTIPQPLAVTQVQGGRTIIYDGMESLLKWREFAATVAVDNTNAFNGGQCLKLTGAAGAGATAYRFFPLTIRNKYRLSFVFMVDDFANLTYLQAGLLFFDLDVLTSGIFQLLGPTFTWQTYENGAWVNIETVGNYGNRTGVDGPWYKAALTVDLHNNRYNELQVGHRKWNLENHTATKAATAAHEVYGLMSLDVDAEPASNVNVWIDDVLLEEIVT